MDTTQAARPRPGRGARRGHDSMHKTQHPHRHTPAPALAAGLLFLAALALAPTVPAQSAHAEPAAPAIPARTSPIVTTPASTAAPTSKSASTATTSDNPLSPVRIQPSISIIIDDVGYNLPEGEQAVSLPGPVTLAFLPHTPYAARLARMAHHQGKQVMLHLPMAAEHHQALGPGGLTMAMNKVDFLRTLRADLASIPYVAGVNNHMGSLLTQHRARMRWLMHDLMYQGGGLFFVDSRTSSETVAQHVAIDNGIANTRRDVFLDNVQEPAAIRRQFIALIAHARRHGTALGIGHPHPTTLRTLALLLPQLEAAGVRLVPVSELIRLQQQRRLRLWQASSSRSLLAAKNSKP